MTFNPHPAGVPYHLVVWVDHQLARLYALAGDAIQEKTVHNDEDERGHVHHHAGTIGAGHVALGQGYLERISDAIGAAQEILIVGPASARTELKSFLDMRRPHQAGKVVAVKPMGHASEAEIIAFARRVFARTDRMTPLQNRERPA